MAFLNDVYLYTVYNVALYIYLYIYIYIYIYSVRVCFRYRYHMHDHVYGISGAVEKRKRNLTLSLGPADFTQWRTGSTWPNGRVGCQLQLKNRIIRI